MTRKLLIWGPLALFLFFAGIAAYQLTQPKDDLVRSTMIGKPVPAFNLPGLSDDDPRVTEAVFRDGQPKLLNIWASWCAPCIAEAPYMEQLAERGAPIVGSALQDKPEDSRAFLDRYGNPYVTIIRDQYSELKVAVGSGMVPETFVIDGKGVIRYQHLGPVAAKDVPVLLAELERAR